MKIGRFLILCLGVFYLQSSAQYQIPENKNFVKVPFELKNNLMVVHVSVNNIPLRFLFDSGTSGIVLIDSLYAPILTKENREEVQISGLGKGEEFTAVVTQNNLFELGEISNPKTEIILIKASHFSFNSKMGIDIHGILGADILKHFIVKINYVNQKITFYKRTKIPKKYEEIPLVIERGKPFIHLPIQQRDDSIDAKLLIDTGNSDAIWLFKDSINSIPLPEKYIHDLLGFGLSGDVFGEKCKLQHIQIGKYSLQNFITSYPDSLIVNRLKDFYPDRSGSIGGEMLHRFHIIFDVTNNKAYFKKNRNFYSEFAYNKSGIHFMKPIDILPYYEVYKVTKNSLGEKLGIQEGDILRYLDGKSSVVLNLYDIDEILSQSSKQKIPITIERNGVLFQYQLELKDIL